MEYQEDYDSIRVAIRRHLAAMYEPDLEAGIISSIENHVSRALSQPIAVIDFSILQELGCWVARDNRGHFYFAELGQKTAYRTQKTFSQRWEGLVQKYVDYLDGGSTSAKGLGLDDLETFYLVDDDDFGEYRDGAGQNRYGIR